MDMFSTTPTDFAHMCNNIAGPDLVICPAPTHLPVDIHLPVDTHLPNISDISGRANNSPFLLCDIC